jgi:rRNA processing protein Krr1/Pno1
MSKSARKRANKKAREAEEEVKEEPPVQEPKAAPKPKPKAKAEPEPPKAAEPKPKAKADAKAKPKAAPKEAPKKEEPPPAPEPKPKAKADAKAKAKQASSKPAAKPKAKAKQEEEEPVKKVEDLINYTIDDGSGGGWDTATGLSSKQAKQKARKEEEKKYQEELKKAGTGKASAQLGTNVIPGMKPPEVVAAEMRAAAAAKSGAKAKSGAISSGAISAAAADQKGKEPEKPSIESFTATVKITDEKKIGWVVGPKGATIAMLKEKTGVKQIDTAGGNVVTIVGGKEEVARAEEAVQQLIEKGYCALQYDGYEETGVMVHPQHFHQIIGKEGAIIQLIKKEAKVEVSMPNVPKTAPNAPVSSKKYKVTLAGSKESVAKGKEVIESIVLYGYHELTHPGFTHQEVECEEWKYKYLIGTKGSEMRHIQKNFGVQVNIPRAGSDCPNVVVTGEAPSVDRAVKYIEKVMWNADQPKGRGSADQADDAWGEEAADEDWMKAYIYKRK